MAATSHVPEWDNSYLGFIIPVVGIVVGLPLLLVLAVFTSLAKERLLEAIEVKRFGAENSSRRASRLRGLPPLSFSDPRCEAPMPPPPNVKAIEMT